MPFPARNRGGQSVRISVLVRDLDRMTRKFRDGIFRYAKGRGWTVVTVGAAAVGSFRRLVGRLPFVIGDEFYRWSDEAVSANGRTETMNWGLVDLHGRPHEEVGKAMRKP